MLTDAEMEHLKTLARLEVSPEETEALKDDLNQLLGYFGETVGTRDRGASKSLLARSL